MKYYISTCFETIKMFAEYEIYFVIALLIYFIGSTCLVAVNTREIRDTLHWNSLYKTNLTYQSIKHNGSLEMK